MAKTRKRGKGFLELCPNCMGELKFLEAMIIPTERFDWVQCRECKRVCGLSWAYKGWKEVHETPSGSVKGK